MQLFEASWRESKPKRDLRIRDNLAQLKRLSQSPAISFTQLEEILQIRKTAIQTSDRNTESQDLYRLKVVKQWLCPFDSEAELDCHRKVRSMCKDPGRWLLNDERFQKWYSPNLNYMPLLWLNGVPGAGMSPGLSFPLQSLPTVFRQLTRFNREICAGVCSSR